MVKVVGQDNTVSVDGYAGNALIDPAIVLVGKDGKDGKDGVPGPEGVPGRDGIDGRDGKDGKDGRDGVDGKDGTSYWIEYDKKKGELVFKNDGGKKNPAPIKISEAKGWGYGAGGGRGGVTAQPDWNQTDKNAVDFIKNKPVIQNIQVKIMQEPTKELKGLVVQYIGETTSDYKHGYFYECLEKTNYDPIIGFYPSKIGFDYDNDLISFFAQATQDYAQIKEGVFEYLEAGDIWSISAKDKDGNIIFSEYKLYSDDLRDAGFVFLFPEYEDEEKITYELALNPSPYYVWERIDVQPGATVGRFLSLWDSSTGLAQTNPPESPYVYKTGDYFIVGTVGGSTNYKPDGLSYTTGVASTTVETESVSVEDVYFFDGAVWKLRKAAHPDAYELIANKVTSISSASTDTQYPSAKCVWDIVGDVESAINAIRGV